VGGGPAGLVAGYKLAKAGFKTALFERKLSIGGGMWGGGMMMNEIVVQEEAKRILDEMGVASRQFQPGYHTADSVLCSSTLCSQACQAGLTIFNLVSVEDVMVRDQRVVGLVINWSAVEMAKLHVDPLTIRARYTIDATGHAAEVVQVIARKVDASLFTKTGGVMGERSLWAEVAESHTLNNTREAFPGVFTAGMCSNATFGSYRMGPVFGGMLLSGEKAAQMVAERLKAEK
jgi:thiamine thiazole synthase